MRVSIPDHLYEQLLSLYKSPQAVDRALTSAGEVLALQPKGRTITLDSLQIAELEQVLGNGSLLHGPDLMRKVHALAAVQVHGAKLEFDASDLARLQQRAARRDLTTEQYLRVMLDRFKEEWSLIGEPVQLETAAK